MALDLSDRDLVTSLLDLDLNLNLNLDLDLDLDLDLGLGRKQVTSLAMEHALREGLVKHRIGFFDRKTCTETIDRAIPLFYPLRIEA